MAPELRKYIFSKISSTKTIECSADIYSFGVIIKEFLGETVINTSSELKLLLDSCLLADPSLRPVIDKVIEKL